ncbi:lipoprotein-anchoring transpeptidase ErfK/SrfK [Microvirga lupini]|uniref:Lipoprotein-anchoring transpeptidase ErfK/SrfK n=1 Tax=Microvirga lupini TaxID=420324 RepID=A0A7W4YWK1_9HYPH|nr:L,D-transpeptidase [Microvirga lupini]MBB3019086.1 lipoprotein-anchoring transpeptidase ErfK/SrfK [Microvirga lupini]
MLLASLLPAPASAQFYGNTYIPTEGRYYPYAQTQDGYPEGYPLVTRPSSRTQVYRGQRTAGYSYDVSSTGSVVASLPQDYGTGTGYDNSIDYAISPEFQRQIVSYGGRERPGTIVVDTNNKFLYLVQDGGRAIRYGIGVGREGFEWSGRQTVSMKREWPSWRPPADMLRRRPDLPRFMEGGPDNPLGARALYLGSSLYRIHGTNEPHTIGQAVSSGCIRMLNDDVVDLYNRVKVGTSVIVI